MENVTFKVGELLIIETGCYSDQTWDGPVRVLKEFSKKEAAGRYIDEYVPDPDYFDSKPQPDGFLPWLVKEGYVEGVHSHAWHVGEYSTFDPGV